MKAIKILLVFLVFTSSAFCQEITAPYSFQPPPEELKNLQWNRWTTNDNFTILSIDNEQGKWLHHHLGDIKKWCVARWGFPDNKLSRECRVMCVPNKELMKKLFNTTEPTWEVKKDLTALWLVLDDKPSLVLPELVSSICFAESNLGVYAIRGMSLLNLPKDEIRSKIKSIGSFIGKDTAMITSEKLISLKEPDYKSLSSDDRNLFDKESLCLSLFLRKEFGEYKMREFFKASNTSALEAVKYLGFKDFQEFDKSFFRYMRDLSKDVNENKTPDFYLDIKPV